MENNLCIRCNLKPIWIKKRKLCASCYQRERRENNGFQILNPKSKITIQKHRTNREIEFVKNYFIHNNWIHQPAIFNLGDTSYKPDFYDIETDTFIEVAGSRQAYHQNKEKYSKFKKIFPNIKLEIRTPDGILLSKKHNGKMWECQYKKDKNN